MYQKIYWSEQNYYSTISAPWRFTCSSTTPAKLEIKDGERVWNMEVDDRTMTAVKFIASTLVLGGFLVFLYHVLLVKPLRLTSRLAKQGIRGPSPSFLLGNIPEIRRILLQVQTDHQLAAKTSQKMEIGHVDTIDHDWPSTIFPHLKQWINQYGPTFMYSTGNIHQLCTTDIDMVKEISLCASFSLGKPSYLSKDRAPLLGQSIFSTNGPVWAHQRKIIAPAFYIDRVKSMVNLMVDSATSMVRSWDSRIEVDGGIADIDVDPDMRTVSAEIISRACFGSNYNNGIEICSKLRTLQDVMAKLSIRVPGLRHFPSKNNREVWKLEEEINSMISGVVKERIAANCEDDLLQMILEGAKSYDEQGGLSSDVSLDKFIVDNCKAIYFAGHETSAITASWCLMLLATHQDWQTRARAEVLDICKDNPPDAHMLRDMKTLAMVIQETLRLYPPAVFVNRTAMQDIKFKDITVPKGTNLQIPISIIQQDPGLWGPDAHRFNPERFANGILGASKSPHAYMPFGMGSHICVGQHFAMAELKVVLSLILSKFSFSLSPTYRHTPQFRLLAQPGNGVGLLIRSVS